MKKIALTLTISLTVLAMGCSKNSSSSSNNEDVETIKTAVITDFTNNVALPGYQGLADQSVVLNNAITTLKTTPTDANLEASKIAWKNMRAVWEQCEGFLFGPVEDNDYDPNMDTWPTDYVQMDSLLNSNNSLSLSEVQAATLSLRGYHPIEYIMWGKDGKKMATDITDREKTYISSLSQDLTNTCTALNGSWTQAPENFAQQVLNSGKGSTKFTTQQSLFLAIVGGMTDICDEVGTGKMKEPYDLQDSKIVESPYSGTSTADFKNNIVGLQNVYLGTYNGKQGRGLTNLVAFYNKDLDNRLKVQISNAINSFNNITLPYGEAIISQRTQCKATMDALATLQNTLDTELKAFIIQYVKN